MQLKKEKKGKMQYSKPRKPRHWVPTTVTPNPIVGFLTRATTAVALQYQQHMENNDGIHEVLAQFHEDDEGFPDMPAPESQYTVGSMETCNVDLWETVFQDEEWQLLTPMTHIAPPDATQLGGQL